MRLWNSGPDMDKVDLSIAVGVELVGREQHISFPGADRFKVDGDGDLSITMMDFVVAVVARGMWVFAWYQLKDGTFTARTEQP